MQALEFFAGVPRLNVPDQARALIKNSDTYDPQPNRLVKELLLAKINSLAFLQMPTACECPRSARAITAEF